MIYTCGTPGCPCITIDFTNMQTTQKSLSVICTVRQLLKWKKHQAELNNETTEEDRIAKKWDDFSKELRVRLQKAASDYFKNSVNREATNCQCANGPAQPFNSTTAKRKEERPGVTSVLKRQKLDYGCGVDGGGGGGVEGGDEGGYNDDNDDDEGGDDDNDDSDDRLGNEAHLIVQNQANVPQSGFPFIRSPDLPPMEIFNPFSLHEQLGPQPPVLPPRNDSGLSSKRDIS